MLSSLVIAWVLVTSRLAFAISTISIKGSKFFTDDGNQFFIKGVNYAPDAQNFNQLLNGEQCRIDAKLLQDLGANVIRVYVVDPTLNHDECMKAFEDAGIYVIVDMSTPELAISRDDPTWNITLRNAFAQVIDGFQGYDNMMAFFAGNSIINNGTTSSVAPYAKAVVSDLKAYRELMQYRKIPIGYAAADLMSQRKLQMDYFDCGNESVAVDFHASNNFAWCGDSTMESSGYQELYEDAEGFDIPVIFSETGCNVFSDGRYFTDQVAVLGRAMNDRFSGSIIYQWSEDASNYGLVNYSDSAATGTPSLMPDYTNLKLQWATLSPTGVKASAYDPTLTRRECPSFTSSLWVIQADASLPTLGTTGFTAPVSGRATSTGSVTSGASNASSGSASPGGGNSASVRVKPNAGPIAATIVSTLVVVGLITGAVIYFIRRKRKQSSPENSGIGITPDPDSDKIVAPDDGAKNGFYGPKLHEMSGQGTTPELDPARGHIAPMPAPEMEDYRRPGELVHEDNDDRGYHSPSPPPADAPILPTHPEPSPYVQAQRHMEMEWLEGEEARLRQRREVLRRQDGGDSR